MFPQKFAVGEHILTNFVITENEKYNDGASSLSVFDFFESRIILFSNSVW